MGEVPGEGTVGPDESSEEEIVRGELLCEIEGTTEGDVPGPDESSEEVSGEALGFGNTGDVSVLNDIESSFCVGSSLADEPTSEVC